MNENDMELRLLRGLSIEVEGIGKLYPLTLDDISRNIGEEKYTKYIFAATFKRDDIEIEGYKLTPFQSVLIAIRDDNFRELFLESLSKFFNEQVHFHFESGLFYLGDITDPRVVNEEKYYQIVEIIKKQNFIKSKQEDKDEFNPDPNDEQTKEMIEKLKNFRQKVKEKNQENGLNLCDIISIVAAHAGNLNIFAVWDLTVYQLYTLYIRLMMKENYESQFYLLPHTSKPDSLDLKHWAAKIQE